MAGEVANELVAGAVGVQGKAPRQDQGGGVPPDPEGVDHRGQEAEHPPGALEALEGGPVLVEPVKELRMDGVGEAHPLLVAGLEDLAWELPPVLPVVAHVLPHHGVPHPVALRRKGLEEPAAHDLVGFVLGGGLPHRLQPPEDVLQPEEGLPPPSSPHLGVGGGKGGHHQGAGAALGRLGQGLGEGEVLVKGPGGEALLPVEVAQEGHPLVYEHQGRAEAVKELLEGIGTRGHPRAVLLLQHPVALHAPELVGDLPPEGAHHHPLGLGVGTGGAKGGAHEDCPAGQGHPGHPCLGQEVLEARHLPGVHRPAEEVVEGKHGVGLPPAKGRLELHHRVPPLPC